MAKFLSENDTLVSLILSKNNLTTKGANHLLPALKENTSLQKLDLSNNWLSNAVADTVINVLKSNSTLLNLDLSRNNSMKMGGQTVYSYRNGSYKTTPEGAKALIVKKALLDTTSLESIASSNHTCEVKMSELNHVNWEETIRKINALDVSQGQKIRLKVVLAMSRVNTGLYDPRSFDDVPLGKG